MNDTTIMLLGYIGPETMLPFASVIAGAVGVLLIFWRFIIRLIRRVFGMIFGRRRKATKAENPLADQSGGEEAKS